MDPKGIVGEGYKSGTKKQVSCNFKLGSLCGHSVKKSRKIIREVEKLISPRLMGESEDVGRRVGKLLERR